MRQHLASSPFSKCLRRWGNTETGKKFTLDSLALSPFILLLWTWWQKGISPFRHLIPEAKNTESPSCTHTQRTNSDHDNWPQTCPWADWHERNLVRNWKPFWSQWKIAVKFDGENSNKSSHIVICNGQWLPQATNSIWIFSTNQEHLYRILEAFSIHNFCHIPRKRNNAFGEKADRSVAKPCEITKSCYYEIL